jgi:hypothetical protein
MMFFALSAHRFNCYHRINDPPEAMNGGALWRNIMIAFGPGALGDSRPFALHSAGRDLPHA